MRSYAEYDRCEHEVCRYRYHVCKRRYHRACHEGRVYADLPRDHGQHPADAFRDHDYRQHRYAYGESYHHLLRISPLLYHHPHEGERREAGPDGEAHSEFLPQHPSRVLDVKVADADASNDQRCRLRSGVSSGTHQHGHVCYQADDCLQSVLKVSEYRSGQYV